MIQTRINRSTQTITIVWEIGIFEFKICFGFRASYFEFYPCLVVSY